MRSFHIYGIISCISFEEGIFMKPYLSFRRGDLVAVGVILLAALGLGLFFLGLGAGTGSVTVEIRRDGQLVESIPLTQDKRVTVDGDYTNVIVVRDGAVWMESSDCPGADCVHSGKISAAGRAIVCLPNRVEVRLVGEKQDGVDMVVGE